jgi:hypothetical protein
MTKSFTKAIDCAASKDNDVSESYVEWVARCEANERKGAKQIQCGACARWCWPEDRCNLFTKVKAATG